MQITIDTSQPLSKDDQRVLEILLVSPTASPVESKAAEKPAKTEAKSDDSVTKAEAAKARAKARAEAKAKKAKEPEPEPEPEPMAEEAVEEPEEAEVEEPEEDEDEDEDEDDLSDEDLLSLAVKKGTEMVASGDAAKVREALEAAGASRVRELNKDNVRDFFKALS